MKTQLPSNMRRPELGRLVLVGGCNDERVRLLESNALEEPQSAKKRRLSHENISPLKPGSGNSEYGIALSETAAR